MVLSWERRGGGVSEEIELLNVEGVGGRSSVELVGLELGCYPREIRVRCRIWREHVEVPCVGPGHRHLVLRTYDDVIEVLCTGFTVEFGEPRDVSPVEGDDEGP
jgi:hypothetical protein